VDLLTFEKMIFNEHSNYYTTDAVPHISRREQVALHFYQMVMLFTLYWGGLL